MIKSILISVTFLLFVLFSNAQLSDKAIDAIKEAANKGGYGVILFKNGSQVYTESSSAFKGIIQIDAHSPKLYEQLNGETLNTPEAQKILLSIAMKMVTAGVASRTAGNLKEAIWSYRAPLFITCKSGEWAGAEIISNNMWIVKEIIKDKLAITSIAERGIVNTDTLIAYAELLGYIKNDAEYLINAFNIKSDKEDQKVLKLQAFKRIADFSEMPEIRREYLKRVETFYKSNTSAIDNYLNSLIEELVQTSMEDIISNGRFKDVWQTFLQDRNLLDKIKNKEKLLQKIISAFNQFSQLRSDAIRAGGATGHRLSYQASNYMQYFGRDAAGYYTDLKRSTDALTMAEKTRARALGDWIGRSHPNRRLTFVPYKAGSVGEAIVASTDEIAEASKQTNAPLLIYLAVRNNDYLTWLILPDKKYVYAWINIPDSLIQSVFKKLPYNFSAHQISATDRNKRGAAGDETDDKDLAIKKDLKALYNKLVPALFDKYLDSLTTEKLVIIPDGALNFLPFCALVNRKDEYLLQSKEIVYWPSVTSWLILKDAYDVKDAQRKADAFNGKPKSKDILLIGNPTFSQQYEVSINGKTEKISLNQLPGTQKEVDKIGELFKVTPLVQKNANTKIFNNRINNNIIHLATHGILNQQDAMNSFIALSDGALTAEYFYENASITKTQLFTLSACQTGLGDLNYDSPIGLTNSILVGGANSVCSSLWQINDNVTSLLMVDFYSELKKGSTISKAIRTAQLNILKDNKTLHPYYWAAFKITGLLENPL